MRLLIILVTLVPLALAKCPSFFEGLDASLTIIERFDEAVDTACGRRNYTSLFWSKPFYEQLINQMVTNSSEGERFAPFKAFIAHLHEKIDALDTEDASDEEIDSKDYFDSAFEKNERMQKLKEEIEHPKPTKSPEEMAEPGAFMAGRVGLNSHNEKLGELLARLYVLVTAEYGIPRSPFDEFVEWSENQWKSPDIGALEILPAAEILYLQYQSLTINVSRTFVDWMLISHVDMATLPPTPTTTMAPSAANETMEQRLERSMGALRGIMKIIVSNEDVIEKLKKAREERKDEFAGICPSQKDGQCFKDFPEEARKEIIATFPEIFVYLKNRFNNFYSSSLKNDNSPIEKKEIEGSGEGSGLF